MTELSLKPSPLLGCAACAVLAGALAALALAAVPLWFKCVSGVLLSGQICYCGIQLCSAVSHREANTLRVRLAANGCQIGDGSAWRRYHLPGIRFAGECLLILELTPELSPELSPELAVPAINRFPGLHKFLFRRRLLLASDSLSKQDHWRLRRYLHNVLHNVVLEEATQIGVAEWRTP